MSSSVGKNRSRFVARIVLISAVGWIAVTLLNVTENSGAITDQTENLARLCVWGVLLVFLNTLNVQTLWATRMRWMIPWASVFILVKLVVDVTRDTPAFDGIPLIGRDGTFSYVLPPVALAVGTILMLVVIYHVVQLYDDEHTDVAMLTKMTGRAEPHEDRFQALARNLGQLLEVAAVIISEVNKETKDLGACGAWYRSSEAESSVTLPQVVCAGTKPYFLTDGAHRHATEDVRIAKLAVRGYLALPLTAGDMLLGYLEVLHDGPLPEDLPNQLVLGIVQVQAAVELARQHAKATSQAANEQLAQSEHLVSIGRMAAGIAHEVNNPLCIISAQTEVAKLFLKQNHVEEALDCLVDIEEATRRAGRVIDSVLKSAREEPVEKYVTEIGPIVHQVRDMLRDRAQAKQIQIDVDVPAESPKLLMDPTSMEQLLTNLVINSLDAVAEGGRVTVSVAKRQDGVDLSVRDNGSGMDPATARHMFDPFFSTKQGGTGLGLSIVHRIARDHGATFHVDSSAGAGTTVQVGFPKPQE